MSTFIDLVPAGVITGDDVQKVFKYAKAHQFALPAANCTGTDTVNAALETAAELNAPMIIQFSNGGAAFYAGKGLSNSNQRAAIAGAVSAALHVHELAEMYGARVMLHTDHCAKKLLPWVDGLLDAGEAYFKKHGRPLYSSHMLDLSEDPLHENVEICKRYLERMSRMGMTLELELGVTGGEEDGVDNTDVDSSRLYTQPSEVAYAYEQLVQVSPRFTIAASFGIVHGVYKPGNVKLRPEVLKEIQDACGAKYGVDKPFDLVFHGGSGSSAAEIREAIEYGVVKMNIDTDTQYAFTRPIADHMFRNYDGVLKIDGEVGNKKAYDPRTYLTLGEEALARRVQQAVNDLGSGGTTLFK